MENRLSAETEPVNALLGAGKHSEHVLHLMHWAGLSSRKVVLFDDAHPARQNGALGHVVRGSIAEGVEWLTRNRLPAMVTLGSRHAARRYSIFRVLQQSGIATPTIPHPTATISSGAALAGNSIIMPGCVVAAGVRAGALLTLFSNVTIEHDSSVGENVTFGPGVVVSGFVQIGSHSFIGAGATIAPESKIGERVMIGAGSVVVSDIPSDSVAYGVPARVRRELRSGDDAPTAAALFDALAAPLTGDQK